VICYKDQAYCSYSTQKLCKNYKCGRYLTRAEGAKARKMGLLICLGDYRPRCGTDFKPTDKFLETYRPPGWSL
jgi:hypothetical protein